MALERDIERLSRVPLFAAMDPDALRLMAFAAEPRAYRAGEVLFGRNEAADGAVLVLTGAVSIAFAAEARTVGPGALIDPAALLIEVRRAATAVAREPATVLKLSRTSFLRVLDEHPHAAFRLRRQWARGLAARLAKLRAVAGTRITA